MKLIRSASTNGWRNENDVDFICSTLNSFLKIPNNVDVIDFKYARIEDFVGAEIPKGAKIVKVNRGIGISCRVIVELDPGKRISMFYHHLEALILHNLQTEGAYYFLIWYEVPDAAPVLEPAPKQPASEFSTLMELNNGDYFIWSGAYNNNLIYQLLNKDLNGNGQVKVFNSWNSVNNGCGYESYFLHKDERNFKKVLPPQVETPAPVVSAAKILKRDSRGRFTK
jgi:hypothetical protein